MTIGTNIKKLRKNKGWTQEQLAKHLGVSQKVVCDYEREVRKPPIERLPKIAAVFDISIEELIETKELKLNGAEKHIHGNQRIFKLQELFEKLSPSDQRSVIKHVSGLLAQAETQKK